MLEGFSFLPTAAGTGSFNNNNNALVPSSSLPVELISFSGKKHSEGIALTWITATELNNDGFEIQRSQDAQTWETLDFIQGAGTTLIPQSYIFNDKQPFQGLNYYRLKQYDFDDNFEYSDIILLNRLSIASDDIHIFPNPTAYDLMLNNAIGEIFIYDKLGKLVRTFQNEDRIYRINVSDLFQGVYMLVVRKADGSVVTKQFVRK